MKLTTFFVAVVLLLACVSCRGSKGPVDIIDPILLPAIPAKYVSDTLVVPDELADEYAALIALPPSKRWTIDVTEFEGEERRAAIYWRFADNFATGNSFYLLINSSNRATADDFMRRLTLGWGLVVEDSNFNVANQQSVYKLFRSEQPRFTKGETAWLCDWLYLNYPQYFIDVIPMYRPPHSEGTGGSI